MIARAFVENVAALNASFIVVEEIRAPKHFSEMVILKSRRLRVLKPTLHNSHN